MATMSFPFIFPMGLSPTSFLIGKNPQHPGIGYPLPFGIPYKAVPYPRQLKEAATL
jgi:hypothetical protein